MRLNVRTQSTYLSEFSQSSTKYVFAGLILLGAHSLYAQALASLTLPDSPGYSAATPSSAPMAASSSTDILPAPPKTLAAAAQPTAGVHQKYIDPNENAPTLTVYNKTILGIKHTVTPLSAAGWVLSAGYSQAFDGSPNYDKTFTGFGQRLGASALRGVSEGVFSDAVLASVLKEDPRYYRMGKGKNVFKRFVYAGTRAVITRTDGGSTSVNFSLLGGNLAGSALTQAYYPARDRGFGEVAKTFGTSILGSAFGFEFAEFMPDFFHRGRKQ